MPQANIDKKFKKNILWKLYLSFLNSIFLTSWSLFIMCRLFFLLFYFDRHLEQKKNNVHDYLVC